MLDKKTENVSSGIAVTEEEATDVIRQREVKIEVDEKIYKIPLGKHAVAEIKKIGHVPQAFDLEQIIDGKMDLLPDDGFVKIEGGEKFVSHPKDGGSS